MNVQACEAMSPRLEKLFAEAIVWDNHAVPDGDAAVDDVAAGPLRPQP